jgi:hypothetical protein
MTMRRPPDFVRMACTTASVSYREWLTENELIEALLTGEAPERRAAHLCTLLEEAPEAILLGLVEQLSASHSREQIEENILKIAIALQVDNRVRRILRC